MMSGLLAAQPFESRIFAAVFDERFDGARIGFAITVQAAHALV